MVPDPELSLPIRGPAPDDRGPLAQDSGSLKSSLPYFPAVPQEPRREALEEDVFLAFVRGLGWMPLPVVLFIPTALLWAVGR